MCNDHNYTYSVNRMHLAKSVFYFPRGMIHICQHINPTSTKDSMAFEGTITDLMMWNRVLSDTDIVKLINAQGGSVSDTSIFKGLILDWSNYFLTGITRIMGVSCKSNCSPPSG